MPTFFITHYVETFYKNSIFTNIFTNKKQMLVNGIRFSYIAFIGVCIVNFFSTYFELFLNLYCSFCHFRGKNA